jgi:hypothetical protein
MPGIVCSDIQTIYDLIQYAVGVACFFSHEARRQLVGWVGLKLDAAASNTQV